MSTITIGGIGPLVLAGTEPVIITDGIIQTSGVPTDPNDVITLGSIESYMSGYVKADGSVPLTADWDVGAAGGIICSRIDARNLNGLLLMDDNNNYGIHVGDGGNVAVGKLAGTNKFEVDGDIQVPFSQSLIVGGVTSLGNDGFRLTAVPDYAYIDLKGGGRVLVRVDDVNGGTEILGISNTEVSVKRNLEVWGSSTLGNESVDLITCVGRLVHRTLSSDPTSTATAGNLGEIAFHSDNVYVKTVSTGTDTNWVMLGTAGTPSGVLLADGTVMLSANWNAGSHKIGIGMTPVFDLDVTGDIRASGEIECETLDVNGGGYIGDSTTDVFIVNGRWCLREVGMEPGVDSVPGSVGEIVMYENRMYAKTNTGVNDWYGFDAIGHSHAGYVNKDGSTQMTAHWNIGEYRLGLNRASPSALLDVNGSGGSADFYFRTYANNTGGSELSFRKSRSNVVGTETVTQSGDALGTIYFNGVDSGGSVDGGAIITAVQNGSAGTRVPTDLTIETYSSTGKNTSQLVLGANGKIGVNQTPSGFYALDVNGGGKFTTTLTTDGKLTANGNADLGTDEDDVVNIYGSLLIRNLGAVPTSTSTYGRRGEISRYNDHLYLKTVDTGTNTNWVLIV